MQSDMRGRFTLRDGVVRFDPLTFDVPGAVVSVTGRYTLRGGQLDFDGTFAMDATLSKAAGGGVKGLLLKPFDPLFRKPHAGRRHADQDHRHAREAASSGWTSRRRSTGSEPDFLRY